MAVVCVENLSTVISSILIESRLLSSSSSGQNANQGRWHSRPPLIQQVEGRLQNTTVTSGEGAMSSQNEQEDNNSTTSEQSGDLGEAERERVREVIREWRNPGINGIASSGPNISPKTQLLGQTEIERVRVVREWIQACERRDNSGGNLEDQVAEIGPQIERVREGLGLDDNEVQTSKKRELRILCGRQALLDLLKKNEEEKERELQDLREICPVRKFSLRNRILIQSVLRISRPADNTRNNTTAETELGFLRQRQTVTGLREGFYSRLQNNVNAQANGHSGLLQSSDSNVSSENETQDNSSAVVVEHDKVDPANKCSRSGPSSICTENVCASEVSLQGSEGQIGANLVHVNGCDREEIVNDEVTLTEKTESEIWQVISPESSGSRVREQIELEETNEAHFDVGNEELQLHGSLSNPETLEFAGINGPEDSSGRDLPVISQDVSRHENVELIHFEETHEHELIHAHHHRGDEDHYPHAILPHSVDLDDPGSEDAHFWDSSTPGDEQVTEDEAREWIGDSSFSEGRDMSQPELDQEEWPDGATDEPSHDNTRENDRRDQSQLAESFWDETGSLQTREHWSPSILEAGAPSTARADIYYHLNDDNAHNIELRELLSRRRVSSLLSSGFRESLDQLVQSYVERQSHTPEDWELHEMLPPPSVVNDRDHVNTNRDEDSSDVDGQTDILGSTSVAPSNRTWEQQFHDIPWSRDIHQRPGTVLEMINDLRIEMVRLHQRVNHMQSMLEACMDGQLELQRTVRQEVSAALNRSIIPSESDEAGFTISSPKWDWVRKGTCCICLVSNIDSLLYRCAHMCTCATCGGVLVEGKGKCPMCQAPVVEVIRAYTLQ